MSVKRPISILSLALLCFSQFQFPALGQNMMVEFPRVGQNFPKLKETAHQTCKKSLKNKENYERVQIFLFGELNKTFIF